MSYPVKIGNAEVLVKSLDEAVELIAKYQRLQSSAAATNGGRPQSTEAPATVDLAGFVADLPEWPQKGLRMIYEIGRGRPVTSEELRKNLGLENNMALTGRVITPLIRHAKRVNINRNAVFITEQQKKRDGSTEAVYSIPKDSLEAIKRGLGIQPK